MHLHVIHCSLQWWRPLYYRIRQPSPALQPRDCPSLFQSTIHMMKLAHHQTSNYYIDYTSHPHDQPHTKLQQKRIPLLCLGLECHPHGHWLWARCKLQVLDLRIEKLVKCLHHANRQKDSGSHSHRSHLYSKPRFRRSQEMMLLQHRDQKPRQLSIWPWVGYKMQRYGLQQDNQAKCLHHGYCQAYSHLSSPSSYPHIKWCFTQLQQIVLPVQLDLECCLLNSCPWAEHKLRLLSLLQRNSARWPLSHTQEAQLQRWLAGVRSARHLTRIWKAHHAGHPLDQNPSGRLNILRQLWLQSSLLDDVEQGRYVAVT